MRTLLLVALAAGLTGCQTAPRFSCGCGNFARTVRTQPSAAEPSLSGSNATANPSNGVQTTGATSAAAAARNGEPNVSTQSQQTGPNGNARTAKAIAMSWGSLPVPVVTVHRIPVASNANVQKSPSSPVTQTAAANPGQTAGTAEAAQLKALINELQQVKAEIAVEQRTLEKDRKIQLLQQQVQRLEDQLHSQGVPGGVPPLSIPAPNYLPSTGCTSSLDLNRSIEQTGAVRRSGAVYQTSSQLEMWPYSPQNNARGAW